MASQLVYILAALGACLLVNAQDVTIVSPQWKALKVVRPFDPVEIFFRVAAGFVGETLTLDPKYQEDSWDLATMALKRLNATHFGLVGPATVAPLEGIHELVWTAQGATSNLTASFEVSCTDGDVCNGMERLVWKTKKIQECVSPKKPLCDDGIACTQDFCENGFCRHEIVKSPLAKNKNCPKCAGKQCKRSCKGKECGSDGCGGTCGSECTDGKYCIEGKCKTKNVQGTCRSPYEITEQAQALNWKGTFAIEGNTKKGINELIPECNRASDASEIIYKFVVPDNVGFTGIDARVHSTKKKADGSYDSSALDTVLQLLEIDPKVDSDPSAGCLRSNAERALSVSCSDDSSPPGSYSSRVTWMLKPGYVYYLHVDGYSNRDTGPFLLTVRLTPQCTMNCQGKFCGDSGCEGVPCGECTGNKECSADGLFCIAPNCKKKCKKSKKSCGPDNCGGSCGTCDLSNNEFCLKGVCTKFPKCNSLLPKCFYKVKKGRATTRVAGCPIGKYCSTDCKCRSPDAKMPDLALDAEAVKPEIVNSYLVETGSCALQEGCLLKSGVRRIVKFSTDVFNQGNKKFDPPNPPQDRPDLYEWAQCHGHYHFQQFAKFELLNLNNQTLIEGQKRSYCAEDSHPRFEAHPKMPCSGQTSCDVQGISIGWVDSYGPSLDCQFLDITDVPAGNYYIRQCTNFERNFAEKTMENNCIVTPLHIPPPPTG